MYSNLAFSLCDQIAPDKAILAANAQQLPSLLRNQEGLQGQEGNLAKMETHKSVIFYPCQQILQQGTDIDNLKQVYHWD